MADADLSRCTGQNSAGERQKADGASGMTPSGKTAASGRDASGNPATGLSPNWSDDIFLRGSRDGRSSCCSRSRYLSHPRRRRAGLSASRNSRPRKTGIRGMGRCRTGRSADIRHAVLHCGNQGNCGADGRASSLRTAYNSRLLKVRLQGYAHSSTGLRPRTLHVRDGSVPCLCAARRGLRCSWGTRCRRGQT